MKKTYLILSGGLGNQMFMFASVYALTKRWERELVLLDYWFQNTRQRGKNFAGFTRSFELDKFERIRTEFGRPNPFTQAALYQTVRVLLKLKLERLGGFHFDRGYRSVEKRFDHELLDHPAAVMMGYYQSHFYFENYRQDLIGLFQLSDAEEERIAGSMAARRAQVGRLVLVHVRREDSLVPGNNWTGLLTPTYFHQGRHLLNANKDQLVIFSDDPAWCRSKPEFTGAWIVDEPDPVRTLRMMTYCDDHLIAGSTLSWWGAWLSDRPGNRVVAPVPFYKDLATDLEKLYIPEQWERLPAQFGV